MLRFIAVSLFSLGFAVLDDSSALIQQSREQREELLSLLPVCTQQDLDEHKAQVEEFRAKRKEMRTERDQKAKEKSQAAEAVLKKKTDAALALAKARAETFLQPMLDKVAMVAKYLEAESKPTSLLIVKSLLQQVVKGSLVDNGTAVDIKKTVTGFLDRWNHELVVHMKSLLANGFASLHENVEKAIQELDPVLQARMHAPYPVHNESELLAYVQAKLIPVTGMKVYPELEEVAKLMVTMPTNPAEQQAWFMKEVTPVLSKHLPSQCQPTKLLTAIGFGFGDTAARLNKFMEACAESLGLRHTLSDTTHELTPVPEPVRKCRTCQENYVEQISRMADPNGCMMHCAQAIPCLQGVDDGCLHKLHPCLRCHSRKLAAYDSCDGTDANAKLISILGDLSKVMKTATVEKGGVNAFMDRLLDVIKA